jgi:benzoyl-CoA reductase subunit D
MRIMVTVGIDSGSQNTKGVLMKDDKVLSSFMLATKFDANKAGQDVYKNLLKGDMAVFENKIDKIIATGSGRNMISFADDVVNEVISASKGMYFINPNIQLLIDIGAEGSHVISLSEDGKIIKYQAYDKCASGAGMFIEAMARALQISVEDIGDYSLRHKKEITTNAQCVVFAESEVISLIHRKESREDIAHGIHVGICNRISSLIKRVGIRDEVALIGGPGHNKGLTECMSTILKRDIFVPEEMDYVNAIGAALYE